MGQPSDGKNEFIVCTHPVLVFCNKRMTLQFSKAAEQFLHKFIWFFSYGLQFGSIGGGPFTILNLYKSKYHIKAHKIYTLTSSISRSRNTSFTLSLRASAKGLQLSHILMWQSLLGSSQTILRSMSWKHLHEKMHIFPTFVDMWRSRSAPKISLKWFSEAMPDPLRARVGLWQYVQGCRTAVGAWDAIFCAC